MNRRYGLLVSFCAVFATACDDNRNRSEYSEPQKTSIEVATDTNPHKNLKGIQTLYLEAKREKDPARRLEIMEHIANITRHDVVVTGKTYEYLELHSVKRELCYQKIKQAYDRLAKGEAFRLVDKETCQGMIWEYDIKYRDVAH